MPLKLIFDQINSSIDFRIKEHIVCSSQILCPAFVTVPYSLTERHMLDLGLGNSGILSREGHPEEPTPVTAPKSLKCGPGAGGSDRPLKLRGPGWDPQGNRKNSSQISGG